MTIDISCSNARAGCIVATGRGIVADHRNNDSGIARLIHDVLKIFSIWERLVAASTSVLVFRLIKNHGSTISYLRFGNGSCYVGNVTAQMS